MKTISVFFSLLMLFALSFSACDNGTDIPGDEPDTPPATSADLLWSSELASPINPALGGNYMPAVDEDDNIYVLMRIFEGGLWGGYAMQKFDKNGNELWEKQSTESAYTPHNQMPTFYQDKLFFTTDEKVIALNASDGSGAWEFDIPDSMQYITPAIAVVNNLILITLEKETAEHSYLFALNPANGNVSGTLAITNDRVWLNMAARGNTVYLVYGHLYKVSVNADGDMHLDWSVQLPGGDETYYISFDNDLVIAPNGNVSFAYAEGRNAQLDYIISYNSAGEKLWEYERAYASHLTLDAQGNIYDGGIKDLLKIDGETGQKVWTVEPPSEFEYVAMGDFTSMVHANNGNLYCGDTYGIYGASNGGEIKYSAYSSTLGIGNSVPFSDISLLSNGNIIVLTMGDDGANGSIHCIKAETGGIATTGWPKRGGNAANTFNVQ